MKKRILVVEDEELTRKIISLTLIEAGYEVDSAEDGHEALNKIRQSVKSNDEFDLLITDINMPNMSGLEMLRKIRNERLLIPSIVVTANRDKETMLKAILNGCNEFIRKPFQQETLLKRVDKFFEFQGC